MIMTAMVIILPAFILTAESADSDSARNTFFNAGTFDESIPGSYPDKWGHHWGQHLDAHQAYVSNIDHISKKNCMVIHAGPNSLKTGQWGLGSSIKNVPNGWAKISFCFKIQGSGAAMGGLGYRILGDGGKTVLAQHITFGEKKITFGGNILIGAWEENVWHKLSLWFPTKGGGQTEACGLLQRQTHDMKWIDIAPMRIIACNPVSTYDSMQLIIAGNRYTAFFDDFKVEQVDRIEEKSNQKRIGKWTPSQLAGEWKSIDFEMPANMLKGKNEVTFIYIGGKSRLDIKSVSVVLDGKEIAIDAHDGSAGHIDNANTYSLSVPKESTGKSGLVLRATVKAADGDSQGIILLK